MKKSLLDCECKAIQTFIRNTSSYLASFYLLKNYADFDFLEKILHKKEYNRYSSFPSKSRKKTFITGRYSAKKAISQLCKISDLSEIFIYNGIFDHPIIQHPKTPNIHVSIAHTDNASIAVAFPEDYPMGIDIEYVCPLKSKSITTQLSLAEINLRNCLDISEDKLAIILWTAKESIAKTLKTGLMVSPFTFEIDKIINNKDKYYETYFKNFFQYKCISYVIDNYILTFCLSEKSEIKHHSFLEEIKLSINN